jgi:hypothetical protein
MRTGTRPRPQRRSSRGRGRGIVFATLFLVTAGVGSWYFLFNGSGPPSGAFVVARNRYTGAAGAITEQAARTNRILDIDEFFDVYNGSITTMTTERDVFRRLADEEEGEAAQIATDAANAAQLGISSAEAFRFAFSRARIDDANGAREQLLSAVTDLDRQAKAWTRL